MMRELRRPFPVSAAAAATSRWREADERFATLTAPISVHINICVKPKDVNNWVHEGLHSLNGLHSKVKGGVGFGQTKSYRLEA